MKSAFKNFIKKLKSKPLVLAGVCFAIFVVIVVILAIIQGALNKSATQLEVLVTPSDASIMVGDVHYKNGTHNIKPGEYKVQITREGFDHYEGILAVESGEVTKLYVLLEQSDGGIDYYETHPDEAMIANTIGGYEASQRQTEALEKHPIFSILPYYCTKYEDNYAVYYEYKLYYKMTGDDRDIIIMIDDAAGNGREDALQYIRDNGFNPDDYQIEYNYYPYQEQWPSVPDGY
ncbi:PEGA domain-containing protein [Candidatus Saccharibacteria bacterium]|nr:PEGA domain-containing protein [Candidatus Saccharibacteria bacterium]